MLIEFQLILLREAGLAPVWSRCSSCGSVLGEDQKLYFSSGSGGMLCRECESSVTKKRPVRPPTLQILKNPSLAQTVPIRQVIDAYELLSYHQRELLGKQTKIMTFLTQLLRKQKVSK